MGNNDVYFVRKEEKFGGDMYWWNIRPEGCDLTDRYVALDFKEAVQRYKSEHSIKGGRFIQEK